MGVLTSEFEKSDIDRKRIFLESRAESRVKADSGATIFDRALAGKLFKDCAALSIMLGDVVAAKNHLWKSGTIMADLGIPSGLTSLALVSPDKAVGWLRKENDFISVLKRVVENPQKRENDNKKFPFIEKAIESGNSTSEFLLLLAALIKPAKHVDLDLEFLTKFRERAELKPRSSVGITEIDLRSFMSIVDQVSIVPEDKSHELRKLSSSNESAMRLSLLRREALLRDLREDTWHWRRIPEPAKLIDFDLLMLGCLSVDSFSSTDILQVDATDLDPFVLLPFRAAEVLRS